MIKAIIFDMDGVLIDSEIVYVKMVSARLKLKYPWITEASLYPTAGMSGTEYPVFMANLMRKDIDDPEFRKDLNGNIEEKIDYAELMREAVPNVLKRLKKMGFMIALASSSPPHNIEKVLTDCGIKEYFNPIVSGYDFKQSKPNPEIYLHTFEALGITADECLIVEDSTYGIRAGKAAGARVIALRDERFCFDQSAADYLIDDLNEIIPIAAEKFKAIFFDNDGTLTDAVTHQMSDSTRDALEQLRQRQVKVILSTGRSKREMAEEHILDHEAFDGYIYLNGQLCVAGNQYAAKHPFTPEQLRSMRDFLNEEEIACMFYGEDEIFCNRITPELVKEQEVIGTRVPPLKDITNLETMEIYQFIPIVDREQEKRMLERVSGLKTARWGDVIIDAMGEFGGKDNGIRSVCDVYGIDPAETAAFGDGHNDIPMFDVCGLSVAMGNASDEVKAAADHTTDDYEHDGIAKALNYFGMIR